MSFMLEVEFSGLCFHIIDPNGQEIGVVLPDARNREIMTHFDGSPAKPHVGYLRYDLANAGLDVPFDPSLDSPLFEGIHRFDLEDLDFDLPFDEPLDPPDIVLPEVKEFAPELEVVPGLFGAAPPPELLARTILRGGRLSTTPEIDTWTFSNVLNPRRADTYSGKFVGSALWTRRIHAEELAIRFSAFDGTEKSVLRLKPVGSTRIVKLKVANLCSDNPLEWDDLPIRTFLRGIDEDFKWFYKLLEHNAKTPIATLLNGNPLPAPDLDLTKPVTLGGGPDCGSLQTQSTIRR